MTDCYEVECPICNGDGSVETLVAGSPRDVEPRTRVTPCDRCDAHGRIHVSADVRRLLEAVGGNVEAELRATKRQLDALLSGTETRSRRIVELEAELGRVRDVADLRGSHRDELAAALEAASRDLTAARAELAVERSKAGSASPRSEEPRGIRPVGMLVVLGTKLEANADRWVGRNGSVRISVSPIHGKTPIDTRFRIDVFAEPAGIGVCAEAATVGGAESMIADRIFAHVPDLASALGLRRNGGRHG